MTASSVTGRRLLAAVIAALALASALSWAASYSAITILFACAVAALTAATPGIGLAIAIASVPLLGTTAGWRNSPFDWTSTAIAAFIGGYFLREAAGRDVVARPVPPPLALFAIVVAASFAAALATLDMTFGTWRDMTHAIERFVSVDHLQPDRRFPPLDAAALLLEGIALAWIAVTRSAGDRARAIRLIALTGAAAAALNVNRAFEVILRQGMTADVLWDVATRVRINIHYPDVNAAGSYFLIPLFISLDLARRAGRTRLLWMLVAAITAAGVWWTGSRAAILASVGIGALWIIRTALAPAARRAYRVAAIAILAVGLVAAGLVARTLPDKFGGYPATEAVGIRIGMAKAALAMVRQYPVFGIGVGNFYNRSAAFESPALRAIYPHENAHNNFLQIFAELGLLGFAAFLWTLWWSIGPTTPRVAAFWRTGEWRGVEFGLFAFLLTCVTGHPLLIPQVAWIFWISLGLAATEREPAPTIRPPSRAAQLATALAMVALAAIPVRAAAEHRQVDRSDVAFGVSDWFRDETREWSRVVLGHATTFVPASAHTVEIPLRLRDHESKPVPVTVLFDGHPADIVIVSTSEWKRVRMLVPPGHGWIKVELVVTDDNAVLLGRLVTND